MQSMETGQHTRGLFCTHKKVAYALFYAHVLMYQNRNERRNGRHLVCKPSVRTKQCLTPFSMLTFRRLKIEMVVEILGPHDSSRASVHVFLQLCAFGDADAGKHKPF